MWSAVARMAWSSMRRRRAISGRVMALRVMWLSPRRVWCARCGSGMVVAAAASGLDVGGEPAETGFDRVGRDPRFGPALVDRLSRVGAHRCGLVAQGAGAVLPAVEVLGVAPVEEAAGAGISPGSTGGFLARVRVTAASRAAAGGPDPRGPVAASRPGGRRWRARAAAARGRQSGPSGERRAAPTGWSSGRAPLVQVAVGEPGEADHRTEGEVAATDRGGDQRVAQQGGLRLGLPGVEKDPASPALGLGPVLRGLAREDAGRPRLADGDAADPVAALEFGGAHAAPARRCVPRRPARRPLTVSA